jgi:hypothetical protein
MPENMTPEIVRLGSNAAVERKPVITVGEVNQAEEAETRYEEMTSLQMYNLLLEGKLPPSAIPLYFQKQKQEDLDRATGALYKRSQPINSVERKFWKEITAQHEKVLAENYYDPQKIAREVAAIEARYEPLINGTPQAQARYFANRARELTRYKWQKPADSTRASSWVANLYGMASQLSKEAGVEQATPAEKKAPQ